MTIYRYRGRLISVSAPTPKLRFPKQNPGNTALVVGGVAAAAVIGGAYL
jgi:hypothetical protein